MNARLGNAIVIMIGLILILGNGLHVTAETTGQASERLSLGGHCPVAVMDKRQWVRGTSDIAVTFDGRTYWFADAESKEKFEAHPLDYIPVLGGDCSVCLVDVNRRIAGNVFHTTFHRGRLFLFPTAEAKQTFKNDPDRYTDCDLAFDGKCVVSHHSGRRADGKREFTAIHEDMLYRFATEENMLLFSRNPVKYAIRP